MLLEEPREIALGAEAEVLGDMADLVRMLAQPADRGFHAQRIDIDARADTGAMAKQMIEVRPGQAAIPGHVIEIDSFGRPFAHPPQRPADTVKAA